MRIALDRTKLDRERIARGLLKGELAKAAGVSANSVSVAYSDRGCGVVVARSIAKALGVSVRSIIADQAEADATATPSGVMPAATRASA